MADLNDVQRLRSDSEYIHFLLAAGELLSSSLDYRSTLRDMTRVAVESVADICILDIGSPMDVEMVAATAKSGVKLETADIARHLKSDPGRPAHPVARVINSGETFFAPHIDDAWIEQYATNASHAEFMRMMSYRSMIVVPVRSLVWGAAGALTLVRTGRAHRQYDANALVFAEDLGRRCGIAIGKARLYSQNRDIAHRLQVAALPHSLPEVSGYKFDSFYEPADASLLVGGDWYDVFLLPDGNVGISIGDVSGHGIEAAALMSSIRNAIRMALVMGPPLPEALQRADFLFRHEAPEGVFCTAAIAVLDVCSGQLTMASAGHPSPLVFTETGLIEPISARGLPLGCNDLGIIPNEPFTVELGTDGFAVFYTDGLIESTRDLVRGEREFRRALMQKSVRYSARPAEAIRAAVVRGPHADDIALLTLTRLPNPGN